MASPLVLSIYNEAMILILILTFDVSVNLNIFSRKCQIRGWRMSSVAVVIQTQTEQTSTNCTYFRPFPSLKMTTTNALLEYVCINVDLFLWYSKQVIVKTASRNIDID